LTRTAAQRILWNTEEETMRRISLPNESEHGWEFDPELKEHVIESRLRRQEMMERGRREARQSEPHRFKKGSLGLTEAELTMIRWEAELQFFDGAKLSDELRNQREQFRQDFDKRLEYFLKNGDQAIREVAESQAPRFAVTCGRAIGKATGQFADMLVQAVIIRRGSKDLSLRLQTELWAACLDFSMGLSGYGMASRWVEKAWGHITREHPLPHVHRLDLEQQSDQIGKFMDIFRPAFRRIVHDSPEWLAEAERKINLRCLLSNAPQRRAKVLSDKSKQKVAMLLTISPKLSAKQVCGKLDDWNEMSPDYVPIPKSWQKPGVRLWIEAHDRFPKRVNTFISKVRKEAGIAPHRDS
jgi:hypothetical protein